MKGIVIGLSLIVVFILCCFLHKGNEEKEQEDKEQEKYLKEWSEKHGKQKRDEQRSNYEIMF